MEPIKPHSKEWYLRLATLQRGYYYPWKSALPPMNGEDVYIQMVHELLSPDKDVLDAGCGHGEFTLSLAGGCRSILGYDRVPEYIRMAQEAGKGISNARFVLWDSHEDVHGKGTIPAEPESFDLLISRRGPLNWLEDARRVSRQGAVLLQLNPWPLDAPPWNELLPEALSLGGRFDIRHAVERRLEIGGLEMESCWTFEVPEVFDDLYQLYVFLTWGHTPDEVPGYDEVRPVLERIYDDYGTAQGVAIPHGRLLWRARVG